LIRIKSHRQKTKTELLKEYRSVFGLPFASLLEEEEEEEG